MATTTDSKWTINSTQAHDYLIDPLIAPDPSEETGLNSTFPSTFAANPNPPIKPTTPTNKTGRPRGPSNPIPLSPTSPTANRRSRGKSLSERYPGDMTHRPLHMLKQDAKGAHRSPHLRKASIPGVDTIDALDTVPGGRYHHEGPFDATLASRNMNSKISPVAAVAETNALALEATPPEMIREALMGHRPLDGVAVVPSGERDKNGRFYEYEESNLMEGLGKWSGVKGPYGSDVDLASQKKDVMYEVGDGKMAEERAEASGIEMKDHPKSKKHVEVQESEVNGESSHHDSKRHSFGDGLKKRIGSLRRKKD